MSLGEKLGKIFHPIGKNRKILPILWVVALVLSFAVQKFGLLNTYTIFILTTICIHVILCASLNLVNGYMGEFSVGHAGFMALGAYTSAIFTTKIYPGMASVWTFPLAVLAAGAFAAFIGFFLAVLSFKTRGDYLAIITLAFLMIVKSALENIPYVGGPRGMLGIQPLTTLLGAFVWASLTIWLLRNLIYSKFGRAITAIRCDEIAANAMGVRTREAKILAFVISAFLTAVAGALFAHQIMFINPGSFDIIKSTEVLVMVYLGGTGSLAGSILGATIFTLLSEWLQPLGTWRMVVMPLLLVFLMLFYPKGILGFRELPWFLPKRKGVTSHE